MISLNLFKKACVCACLVIMTGCATVPIQQQPLIEKKPSISWNERAKTLSHINSWDLKGLIAMRTAKDAWSANWQWQKTGSQYAISLFAPLGAGSLKLTGSPGNILLETSDGKKLTATTPEALLTQQLGWQLPVSSLFYWIRGLPVPGVAVGQKQLDSDHRLALLTQQGWTIQYLSYALVNQIDLPDKIFLTFQDANQKLTVKIIIKHWQF